MHSPAHLYEGFVELHGLCTVNQSVSVCLGLDESKRPIRPVYCIARIALYRLCIHVDGLLVVALYVLRIALVMGTVHNHS